MKIALINYEMTFNNGILSKYANKMKEELDVLGIENVLSPTPLNGYINHHINYLPYKDNGGVNTLMITHIFEGYKLDRVKEAMKTADCGICFSGETRDFLLSKGIEKLEVILPAHDSLPRKKKKIAIVTNVYPDGCKREEMFYDLISFLKEKGIYNNFEFHIMGTGWKFATPSFNLTEYTKILEACDYLLYFGLDEGAMSILDATQVGLKTIAPLSGFHIEIGIDYPFKNQEELNNIFLDLSKNKVEDWNWDNYIKQHIKIWERLH